MHTNGPLRMRRSPLLALALAIGVVLVGSVPALADTPPTRWDRARDPARADAWDLHVRITNELSAAVSSDRGPGYEEMRARILSRVRDELEEAGAAKSPDPRLRFDLGAVYLEMDHFEPAIEVTESGLALAPDHSDAESAWNVLATAHAKLDQSREEILAYDKILSLTVDLGQRARVGANRAEAEMRLGRLDEAVKDYRDALALSESVSGSPGLFEDSVLARWGLAVALDRWGDPSGALREAGLAVTQNGLHIIGQKYVFFVPDYEITYYLALGFTAVAQHPTTPLDGVLYWSHAEDAWGDYATHAVDARADCERLHVRACPEDRWLPLARAHLASAVKERQLAEKRAGVKRTPRARHVGRETMIR
jgi:tetratricopeptide (TPR) repeat protein